MAVQKDDTYTMMLPLSSARHDERRATKNSASRRRQRRAQR